MFTNNVIDKRKIEYFELLERTKTILSISYLTSIVRETKTGKKFMLKVFIEKEIYFQGLSLCL